MYPYVMVERRNTKDGNPNTLFKTFAIVENEKQEYRVRMGFLDPVKTDDEWVLKEARKIAELWENA
jgi:hypothetical protein